MIVNDYKANGRRSLARLEDALEHLREFFTDYRAVEITGDKATAYVASRLDEKAAASTINTELAALSRMFTLGIRSNRVATKPYIGKLALNNTRKGFFEWEQFHAVLKNLPEDLQPAIETAYITGWRIHDEILSRQKHHADPKGAAGCGLIRAKPRTGKAVTFLSRPACEKSSSNNWNIPRRWKKRRAASFLGYFIATVNRSRHSDDHGSQPA